MSTPLILPPIGSVSELTALRGISSKVFDMGSNKRRSIQTMKKVHVPDDIPAYDAGGSFTLEDPDLTLRSGGGLIALNSAWYDFEVKTAGNDFLYSMISKRAAGGSIDIKLKSLGGAGLPRLTLNPVITGNRVTFPDLVAGLDVTLELHMQRIFLKTRLQDATIARNFVWRVESDDEFEAVINETDVLGKDNLLFQDVGRDSEALRRNKRRELETTRVKTAEGRVGPRRFRELTDNWTGQTFFVDPATRVKELRSSVETVYPVEIDPDITETITDGAEDGEQQGNQWNTGDNYYGGFHYSSSGADLFVGWRFTTVAVAQGDTIDLANLIIQLNRITNSGSGQDLKVYGDDVDDAAAWSNGTRPELRTNTTAVWDNVDDFSSTGSKTLLVTDIIQEIVDRGSWVSGNNMALYTQAGSGTYRGFNFDDYDSTGAGNSDDPATLEIDFTAPGGGQVWPSPTKQMAHLLLR